MTSCRVIGACRGSTDVCISLALSALAIEHEVGQDDRGLVDLPTHGVGRSSLSGLPLLLGDDSWAVVLDEEPGELLATQGEKIEVLHRHGLEIGWIAVHGLPGDQAGWSERERFIDLSDNLASPD